jgi:hypothetical protein
VSCGVREASGLRSARLGYLQSWLRVSYAVELPTPRETEDAHERINV